MGDGVGRELEQKAERGEIAKIQVQPVGGPGLDGDNGDRGQGRTLKGF